MKVLDLSRVLAGPLATMILGDMGANVIKVERPIVGDDTRSWGPPFDQRGESAYYLSINRNKLSVALDLENESDRELIRHLALQADVVVDNYKPGTLERRGLKPMEILEANRRLVWCTITGFGEHSSRVGYDLVVQAESGWMSITGEPEGDPMKIGVALADVMAGKDAAIAILAAVIARASLEPSARRLHISLLQSARAALINVAQNSLVTGKDAVRWGNQHPNLVPYQLFHASDRPLIIAVGTDAQWVSCAKALNLMDLAGDESLATNAGRLENRDRIVQAITQRLAEAPASHWTSKLDKAQVPCGVVKTVLESLDDVGASPLTGIAPSVPGSVRLPPPRLNEHGDQIRMDGWTAFTY